MAQSKLRDNDFLDALADRAMRRGMNFAEIEEECFRMLKCSGGYDGWCRDFGHEIAQLVAKAMEEVAF